MENQYGSMGDLRQYMNGRPLFTSNMPPSHHHLNLGHQQYDMVMGMAQVPSSAHHHDFLPDSTTATSSAGGFSGLELDAPPAAAAGSGLCGDGGSGRWPRQETLTLLEIRSRLDSKFKEANQKGPLWDEVSRIMSEEHGYQRSGKKCREKFENLYKYYKKTKEGKAGRQDGKHYRFFRQLEALYGETSNSLAASVSEAPSHFIPYTNPTAITQDSHNHFQPHPKLSDNSLSLSNNSSSHFHTSSSDDSDFNEKGKKRRGKRSLKAKIKDFIDGQMNKLMEKQEAWLEKMMKMIEHKEHERILREEEWRKQETARMEREQKFWANERAWIESRDATLMDALHKLTDGTELKVTHEGEFRDNIRKNDNGNEAMTSSVAKDGDEHWPESEITRLIQLRTSMESKFQQMGICDEVLWEEIAGKMACLGYDKSSTKCKNKWDSINSYLMKCNKKRKENISTAAASSCYNNFQMNNNEQGNIRSYCHETRHDHPNVGNPIITDGCFRYLMGDHADNLWKGGNN